MSFGTPACGAGPAQGNLSTHQAQPIVLGVIICTPEPPNVPLTSQDSPLQASVQIKGARNVALGDMV